MFTLRSKSQKQKKKKKGEEEEEERRWSSSAARRAGESSYSFPHGFYFVGRLRALLPV